MTLLKVLPSTRFRALIYVLFIGTLIQIMFQSANIICIIYKYADYSPRAVQEEGDRGLSPSDLESVDKLVAAKLKGAEVGGTPEPNPGPSHEGSGSYHEVSALSGLSTLTDLPDPGQLFNFMMPCRAFLNLRVHSRLASPSAPYTRVYRIPISVGPCTIYH